ncbi:MAG: hypothetical protein LBN98_03550 [Prevotellaceae bacterium]|nr:hypothetical protein [Prevotellaceae bacterium]
MEVKKEVKVGDSVVIETGYIETGIKSLFKGVVKAINAGERVRLDVEDGMFTFRQRPIVLSEKAIQLKTLLTKLLADTGVTVSDRTADMTVDEFQYNGNVAGALAVIKERLNLTVYLNADGVLYAGLEEAEMLNADEQQSARIKLTYGRNIIENNLSYQTKESSPLKIVVKGKAKDGKETVAEAGMDGGSKQTHYRYNVTDKAALQLIAEQIYKQQSYDGFRGTLTIFGIPLAIPGGTVEYRNDNYKDNEGRYFIKGVETTFNTGGLRQRLTMGYKI